MSSANSPLPYHLSFTTASLRPELASTVAEYFLRTRDWSAAKRAIRADNALQCHSANAQRNVERELRQRVQLLTDAQLRILATAAADDRAAMAWLAMCKRSGLVCDFAVEVLRAKLALGEPELRPSDFESFYDLKALTHPELLGVTAGTRAKLRQVLMRMLQEAGILTKGKPLGRLQRPFLSGAVVRAVETDDPFWLTALLAPAAEVPHYV